MAVQRDGNTVFNVISEVCDTYANDVRAMRDELDKVYWQQHAALAKESYSNRRDQHEAMDRLGKLAAAIKAMDEAHKALNAGRCW